jgi:NitT/TauT family transport system substrate-binding protein
MRTSPFLPLRILAGLLVLVGAGCAPSSSVPSTQAPAAATALAVPPQVTSGPSVATSAAAPAATSAAAVPATRAAAATVPPTQPALPQATGAVAAATSAAGPAATAPVAVPATREAAAAQKPAATINVKGGFAQASSIQGSIYVAREKGFFAQQGLDVQLSQIGGTQQVAALLSGDIQFGGFGGNEVANANLRGADLVMIATCSDLPIFSLFAHKKYTSVPELAGQSIGVTAAGAATDAAAHLFLKQFDMLDKVKIIPAGGTIPSVFAAMEQGNIAGGIMSPPTTARAADAGYTELVNGAKLGVPMNHSGIVVTRKYLRERPEEVKKYLAAYVGAWTFAANPANKAEVISVLAQYTQSDERLAEIGYQAIFPIWSGSKTPRVSRQGMVNLLQVSGVPDADTARPEQFFDNSLIDAIAPPG